jgi:hypothetical protein
MSQPLNLESLVTLINKNLWTDHVQGGSLEAYQHYNRIGSIIKNVLKTSQANTVFGDFFGRVPQKYTKRLTVAYDTDYFPGTDYHQVSKLTFYGGEVDNDWLSSKIDSLNRICAHFDYSSLVYKDVESVLDFSFLKTIKFSY